MGMARLIPDDLIRTMVSRQQWVLRVIDNTRIPGTSNFYSAGLYTGDSAVPLKLVVTKLEKYPFNRVWFQKGSASMVGFIVGSVDDVKALLAAWVEAYGWCPPNAYEPYQPPVVCPDPPPLGFFMSERTGRYVVLETTDNPMSVEGDNPRWST